MSKMIPKPREYTADDPLVIQIILRPTGVWTIQPHPNHHPKMKGRLNDPDKPPPPGKVLKDRILDEWKARNPKQPQPDFLTDPEAHSDHHASGRVCSIRMRPAKGF
jgi:hypothetical protein